MPAPDGVAERIGSRLEGRRPAAAAAIVWLAGFIVLTVVMIGLGLLLTKVLPGSTVARWDMGVSRWFAAHRTSQWNAWTNVASQFASPITAIVVAALAGVALAIARWWRELGLLAIGLTLEASVSLASTFVIARPRPPVPRLEATPGTYSYPSGHAAAAIVLYVGLAIVISSHVPSRLLSGLAWIIGLTIPVVVGFSRVYRGLHFSTDVLASVLLGTACLIAATLAVRSASEVSVLHSVALIRRPRDRSPRSRRGPSG